MREVIATFADDSRNHAITGTEIVRCKDCEYFWKDSEEPFCINVNGLTCPNEQDFCSIGKKKENGDEGEHMRITLQCYSKGR